MQNDAGVSIVVDGETFVVRPSRSTDGGFDFDWISGPNAGYGFSSGELVAYSTDPASAAPPSRAPASEEYFVEQIRAFLSMIDPATGYAAE
jgi:hypothetical protein